MRFPWLARLAPVAVVAAAAVGAASPGSASALPPAPRGPAPVGPALSVDGETGVVYVERGGTQTFHVGDLLDMASRIPAIVYESNPDPDFYNNNGWHTTNYFSVFSTPDCSGQFVRELVTGTMQPTTASASTTFGGAVRTYSVRATQILAIQWLEKSIDIVDTVDETTTYPLMARSECVTVRMSLEHVNLLANGSTGPIAVTEGSPIGLQTDQPTGPSFQQFILETGSDCVEGPVAAAGNTGETVGTTITRPPGTYWFMAVAASGSDQIYTNCVQVTVQPTPAQLHVEGQSDSTTFVTGQSLALYAEGFAPNANLVGLVYVGSTTCTGTASALTTGTADAGGTLDTSEAFSFVPDLSVMFVAVDPDYRILKSTNCVALYHQDSDIELRVNGSLGPVLVGGGEIHLVATGLPEGSEAHAVVGCDGPFEPEDFGQVIGPDGVFEAYLSDGLPEDDYFSVRVALAPPSLVESNCVLVRLVPYLIDPVITVNGSDAPAPVTTGAAVDVVGAALPPDRTATVRVFVGAGCTGESTVQAADTDAEGNLAAGLAAGAPGTASFVVEVDGWTSNCVPLTVNPVPVDPPDPDLGSGPITLRANGATAPQVVAGGTRVDLVAEGVGLDEPFSVSWFATGTCTGDVRPLGGGIGTAGPVGSMTRHVTSTVGFRLTAGARTSNCVQVGWQAAPAPNDPDPLVVVVPDDVTAPNDPGAAGAVVMWPPITADGGVAPVTIDCTHESGDVFPIGVTTIQCTATDSAPAPTLVVQAIAGASFTVTVNAVEPPTIADLPDLTRSTEDGETVVVFPLPDASDNSGAEPRVACVDPSGSSFAVGTRTVTCTATDLAGNAASTSFTITVTAIGPGDPTPIATPIPAPTPSVPLAGVLPSTGGSAISLALVATTLVALGLLLQRARRRA